MVLLKTKTFLNIGSKFAKSHCLTLCSLRYQLKSFKGNTCRFSSVLLLHNFKWIKKVKFLYHTCKRILFHSQSIIDIHPARITEVEVTYHIPSSSGLFSTLTWLTMPRFFSFLASVMVFVPERKHREMYSPFRNRLTFTIQWHKSSCALFGNMPSMRGR